MVETVTQAVPRSRLDLHYTGALDKQPQPGGRDPETQRPLPPPYVPEPHLVEAVNLAIELERPLLLKGEPGCGKTRLAYAVAYELKLPYEAWYIKSTSRARDGLYTFDAVGRLRDAQLAVTRKWPDEEIERIDDPMTYVTPGKLGRAFQNAEPTVVLIDEIDKADIDFPNDLLLELDELRFQIDETRRTDKEARWEYAQQPPVIFITSNDEKDLPDAFLRRCLFYYIQFPDDKRLKEIVQAHFRHLAPAETLVDSAIARFVDLRKKMAADKGEAGKKVSTSELIDWFRKLRADALALEKLAGPLPYPSALLKSLDDFRRYAPHVLSGSPA